MGKTYKMFFSVIILEIFTHSHRHFNRLMSGIQSARCDFYMCDVRIEYGMKYSHKQILTVNYT